ncbi:MAG: ATP-grasp domain-containing protein [Candidatus Dependentiae bacterium]
MHKLRVGVLMGGKSIENEVSFNSGRTVCDHLDAHRYDIIPLFQTTSGQLFLLPWHFLHRGKITDFVHRLKNEAQSIVWDDLKKCVDFIFIAMHGQFAEDGRLQGFLEILDIPYLGSNVFASALCMDKIIQKKILHQNGITVPRGINIYPLEIAAIKTKNNMNAIMTKLEENNLNFPLIIKPCYEGSSLGVHIVFDSNTLQNALINACYIAHKPQPVLIEEKIEGMEFSCISLTDYKTNTIMPLMPTEIVPEANSHFFCYDQKYMPGRASKFTPARCNDEQINLIQQICVKTAQILEITNIARIDGFLTKDNQVIIVDPNSLSGMGPASFLFREAAESHLSHTDVINHLIETELQSYGMLEPLLKQEKKEEDKMPLQKTRIAVLLGGRSNEREISLESGRNIAYKLSPTKYEVTTIFVSSKLELFPIGPKLLIRNSTKEIENLLNHDTKIKWADLPAIADFVFIGLHGGEGENGSVQGALEMLGIPYNGSAVLTSALCMDKYKTCNLLHAQGFNVPKNLLVEKNDFLNQREEIIKNITNTVPLPVIIKPHDDGCSMMVQKAKNKDEIVHALQNLFFHKKRYALIEECITGMELTVGCIGNEKAQALPPSQALSSADILSIEEKFLPGAGENQTPAPLPKKTLQFIQHEIESIYATLNCKGYARIDCFYQNEIESPTKKQRIVFIEANTLPGMTPATVLFHQAAELGIQPMDFIDTIVTLGIKEHTQQKPAENFQKSKMLRP